MNHKIKDVFKNMAESKSFFKIICVVGIVLVLFIVFRAGMVAGFHKASFGRDWDDNYARNFGSPHRFPNMMGKGFGDFGNLPNAHGAIGKIIKVNPPTIIVLDENDNTEKVVLLNDKTEIRMMHDILTIDKLKVDDHIAVIGNPDSSGQIEAKLIRFLPVPFITPIINNK